MSHHTQLARKERYQIYALKTAGQSKAQITKLLGRHKVHHRAGDGTQLWAERLSPQTGRQS